jgi:Fe-S cluster assembly protein SufD
VTILETPPLDHAPRLVSNDPADFPMPTSRQEEWRFAPVERLLPFMEGQEDWGSLTAEPAEFITTSLSPASAWQSVDRASAVARTNVRNVVCVYIPNETVVDSPVVVHLRGSGPGSYGQIEVTTGRFSKATVVLVHDTSLDVSGSIIVSLGDGSELTVLSVIDGSADHAQMWQWPTTIGRDARFVGACITIGGSRVRVCPSVSYRAPGGSAELLGAFLAEGDQYMEHRVFVDHDQPNCVSNVTYKGALAGPGAHTVWVGDVLVRRTAVGTQTYELNRNLLLTEGPRADSVPNLELETGDVVSAGHASATGRFDDEQLFYLRARGIPEAVARQLVVRGFFADVLARIPSLDWRAQILQRIESRLGMAFEEDE